MRTASPALLAALAALAACGGPDEHVGAPDAGPPPDAPVDAPPDPFVGLYDDPSEFPRTDCVPGSLAGFSYAGLWPTLGLRTTFDGALQTYLEAHITEEHRPHLLTADDLLVRTTRLYGSNWGLIAIHACAADADGVLRGTQVYCDTSREEWGLDPCLELPFVAAPLHRIAGEDEALGLALVGEWNGGGTWGPGVTTNVRVDGDVAYLSRLQDGIRIVSIADPAAPVDLGRAVAPDDYVNDLKLLKTGGRTYVVTASTTGRVFDVTDPAAPTLAAEIPVDAHTVFVEGTRVYYASGYDGSIPVWDLSTPTAPVELGAWNDPAAGYHDLYVAGGVVYASDAGGGGLAIVDLTDPARPALVGKEARDEYRYWHSPWVTEVGGRRIAVHGDEGFDGTVRLVDVDPESPTFLDDLGGWSLRPEVSVHNVMAFGERAYIAHYRDGVRVLDLATSPPTMVGYFNTWIEGTGTASSWEGAFGIDVDLARRRIYVADALRGVMILDGDATIVPVTD